MDYNHVNPDAIITEYKQGYEGCFCPLFSVIVIPDVKEHLGSRILKAILLFPIRLVLLPVRLLLLVALCFWGAIGSFFKTVTSIMGFVMMVTSVFCLITKIMDVPVFVEMFLAGAAFEAIPLLLIKLGEEGMLGLMDLLGRV